MTLPTLTPAEWKRVAEQLARYREHHLPREDEWPDTAYFPYDRAIATCEHLAERAAREQPCDACETNHVPCETCPFVQFARPAAPPNEDEREHCERVAYEYYDARPANPETWQLPLLISRERDAARAEGEAYGRVLAEDADRAVGEILARLTELVEAAEGALHIGVNSEPAHALLIAAVAKAKAL